MSAEDRNNENSMRSRSRSPLSRKERDDDDVQCIELKAEHDEGLTNDGDTAIDNEGASDGGANQGNAGGGDNEGSGNAKKGRAESGRRGGSSVRGRKGGGKPDQRENRSKPGGGSKARVYVANLPFELKWQEVKDLFREKVGAVSFVELFDDLDGKPRGCGIVEFREQSCAEKAVSLLDRYEILGRRIVVKEDSGTERDQMGRIVKGGGSDSGRGARGDRNSGDFGRGRQASRSDSRGGGFRSRNMSGSRSPPREKWGLTYGLSPQFLEKLNISGPLSTSVFVASLDLKVTETKLYEVFRLAGHIVSAKLMVDKDGNSKGCAVIEYSHPLEAVQAISMLHRQVLYDRFMAVRMDRFDDRDAFRGRKSPKLPSGLKGVGNGLGIDGKPMLNFSGGGMGGQGLMDAPMNMNMGDRDMDGGGGGGGGMFQGMIGRQNSGGMMRMFDDDMPRNSMRDDNMMRNDMMRASMDDRGLGMRTGGGGVGGNIDIRSNLDDRGGMMGIGAGFGGAGDDMTMRNRERMMGGMVGGLGMMGCGMDHGGNSSGGMGSMGLGLGSNVPGGSGNVFGLGAVTPSRDMADFGGRQGAGGGGMRQSKDSDFRMDRTSGDNMFARRNERGGSSIVTVRNLPSSNTWQSLLDKFMDVGAVEYAEIISRGVGRVRFASEQNAQRAASLFNRVYFDGQMIEVALD